MTRDELVINNLGLIVFTIKKLHIKWKNDDEFQELKEAGLEGLIIASRKYKASDYKFSTFACTCIKTSILHWLTLKNMHKRILNYADMVRLNDYVSKVSDDELIDFIQDKTVNVERQAEINNQVEEILEIVKEYSSKQNLEILKMSFGLDGYKPMQIEEICQVYGLSVTTIRNRLTKTIRIVQLVLKDKERESYEKRKEYKKEKII